MNLQESSNPNVTFVSSYVPRQCGIATFTHNLAGALAGEVFGKPLGETGDVRVVAMSDLPEGYAYGPEVVAQVRQHRREDYRNAAELINTTRVDVVCLQHEYGLFGGDCGSYLFDLIDRIDVPLVATLHTILAEPQTRQRDILRRICDRCSTVVVMAERARELLKSVYDVDPERIRLIHHGVPDMPRLDPERCKLRFGLSGRPMILTFGLLGPGKSIEVALDALARVVDDCPDVAYVVLGVTHPGERREHGESYRMSLESRAVKLGIQKNVIFHNRYVTDTDLAEYLQAADIYVTPYRGKEQITSGTLAYAVAAGTAVVSTPYWYARELLADGRGMLFDFGDAQQLAGCLRTLLTDREKRQRIRDRAHAFGREMLWSRAARHYADTFARARQTFADQAPALVRKPTTRMRMSLPDVHPDHMYAMTDSTGLLQHAVYSLPDRTHGYSIDDNARALIVTVMIWAQHQDESVLGYLSTYLNYIHYAKPAGGGRFRNFMSYDRRWHDQDGSDDCQGRVMWALGHLLAHAPSESTALIARELFCVATESLHTLNHPRAWALSILGLHYYLRVALDDQQAREHLAVLSRKLNTVFEDHESDDWPWFEDVVTYDNGRIPQALIMAGFMLENHNMVERGLRALRWLLDVQTGAGGVLSLIGNDGWYRKGAEKPMFDQQPLEPAALIGACKAAYRASTDDRWLVQMRRCFEWYIGRNDLGISLIDYKTRGCYDGLIEGGVNKNQGAESVVSWLMSLLIMHEMQTGDAPDLG